MSPTRAPLVLASTSPRRRALLEGLGLRHACLDPGPDGSFDEERPEARVLAHARFKAQAAHALRPDAWLLAADTLVWLPGSDGQSGRFLPKPVDRADAASMLRALSGRRHEVWTGVVLHAPEGTSPERVERADRARVAFAPIPEAELEAYLDGDEWCDKAGAYGIQGTAGRWASLEDGWYGTVVGLAEEAVRAVLEEGPGLGPFLDRGDALPGSA